MVPADVARQLQQICCVSRETLDGLEHLVARAAAWSLKINLVAVPSVDVLWQRHVLDSAQLFPLQKANARKWCDLGSGGGFPGLVIAILARELQSGMSVTLVESDRRKAAFLQVMVRELTLNANVAAIRAETLAQQEADTVSARALAPLRSLLPLVERHLANDGAALLPKGRHYAEEIAEAQRDWAFTVETFESIVSPQSRILRVTNLRRIDVN